MDISIFFAQFFGWYMVIMGLLILVKGKVFLEELLKMVENKSFLLLSGYLTLFLGLTTVILHNVWVEDWRVIITIFGWLTLIKGVLLIGFSNYYLKIAAYFVNKSMLIRILSITIIPLGALLIWVS